MSQGDGGDPHDGPGLIPGSTEVVDEPDLRGRGSLKGCLALLAVLAVVAVVGFLALSSGLDRLKGAFGGPEDYDGEGSGSVLFQVHQGDTTTEIARNLAKADVVASVEAFTDAAGKEARARSIQVGFYKLRKQLPAADALTVLIDPKNLVQATVTVPEGARVRQVVDAIVTKTKLSRTAVTRALANPRAIGLPASAGGNPEGYLFPATYTVVPGETARALLRQMVAKTRQVARELDVESRAQALGLTTEEAFTVASILEYEANRAEDYPKVARVLYNRLQQGMPLQLDSTVAYVSGRSGDVWTTGDERASDSLYNTYRHPGLPPGPIGSPGEATLRAALEPAEGDWLYFVPDFENGTTMFASTYAEHLRNVDKAKEYCRTHEEC